MGNRTNRGRDKFKRYKWILVVLSFFYGLFPLNVKKRLLEHHRNTLGNLGYALRYCLLKSISKGCGDNVSIAPGVYIFNPHNLIVGNNVSIHPMCYIECGPFEESYIRIDDDVSIAHGTTLICTSHTYSHETIKTIKDMPIDFKPIHICNNVWIGAKSTVLCGVIINSGCVIGANSVVTKTTEKDGIYVGTPAKRIKERK